LRHLQLCHREIQYFEVHTYLSRVVSGNQGELGTKRTSSSRYARAHREHGTTTAVASTVTETLDALARQAGPLLELAEQEEPTGSARTG